MLSASRRAPRTLLPLLLALAATATRGAAQEGTGERLAAEELELVDLDLRRGRVRAVIGDLEEILEELPDDFLSISLLARAKFEACDYAGARADAERAFRAAARAGDATPPELARTARVLAGILLELGEGAEALRVIEDAGGAIRPDADARDAWMRGRVLLATGSRTEALAAFRLGAEQIGSATWDSLLAQARCQRALLRIREAASTLVAADEVATKGYGVEPEVLVELGDVYFEAYGEVDDALSRAHSPADLYREALRLHPEHEGARLGLFQLHRFNWRRSRESPAVILESILVSRPDSIEGLVVQVSSAIDDGDLRGARRGLRRLAELAPARRDVRTQRAALLWIDHETERARGILAELLAEDAGDSSPERELGRHLLELYRFAEGLPFLERAVKRDPLDWRAWALLGRAQANSGDEPAARESLARAAEVADGRRDAWRDNMALVLSRMDASMVEHEEEDLTFRWLPDAAPVLERYLIPFYEGARESLSSRYGYTPGPVAIEVFRKWRDFSVRSTGFEGFPALGVCFGPVVTAVSPLSELRGSFSWARTSYHEFTHVVHLGLSHNRCPRWVTEGLATWEEGTASPAWWRNLRREMIDARANDAIFPVRRLNSAFRGPHVIFAYYQSGLLCKLLIERHGFAPMVRLLEAFDRGADLDEALEEVFRVTPEQLDVDFLAFVDRELAGLAIEPRWSPDVTFRRRFRLPRTPPAGAAERAEWQEEWCRVAWGSYWAREAVDAEEALRIAGTAGELPARGLFLSGELLVARGERDKARGRFERGFALGGEDFRARMALAALLLQQDELEQAEEQFLAAERVFPGYDDARFSAELRLADLYDVTDRANEANEARLRWLAFNADDYDVRLGVGEWLLANGRGEEAERVFREANEVDPFRRNLHVLWGRTLFGLGRHEEALREFEVGLLVPEQLDGDVLLARGLGVGPPRGDAEDRLIDVALGDGGAPVPPGEQLMARWRAQESELHGRQALTLLELGRGDEAAAAVGRALQLDPACEPALAAKERLP